MDQLMSQNTNNFNLESNFDSVKRITDDQRTETSEASGEDVPERIRTRFRVKVQLWRHRDGGGGWRRQAGKRWLILREEWEVFHPWLVFDRL